MLRAQQPVKQELANKGSNKYTQEWNKVDKVVENDEVKESWLDLELHAAWKSCVDWFLSQP